MREEYAKAVEEALITVDEQAGAALVFKSLAAPTRQIAKNAGEEPSDKEPQNDLPTPNIEKMELSCEGVIRPEVALEYAETIGNVYSCAHTKCKPNPKQPNILDVRIWFIFCCFCSRIGPGQA